MYIYIYRPYSSKTAGGWNTYNPPDVSESIPGESASYRPLFSVKEEEENEGDIRM
jgi:hypothetical protein